MTIETAVADPVATPAVLWLDDERALDPAVVGSKAANLVRAAAHGLPVLRGFVVTTNAVMQDAGVAEPVRQQLRRAFDRLRTAHPGPLIVRSSSTVEDIGVSSMAGQFESVLGVAGWRALLEAVELVLQSADRPNDPSASGQPMAVLVQPELDAACGGVLFGVDPVTGDRRHVVVDAVAGGPSAVVAGAVTAAHYVLGRRGRLVHASSDGDPHLLSRRRRRRLARLAARTRSAFGSPQDVEFAFDRNDRLWLLQSRPVTATRDTERPGGPVMGPGPVAETFPEPLRPLEQELWVPPLCDGIARALATTGAVSRRRLRRSPVVTTVGGRAAADLELLGVQGRRHRIAAFTPWAAARRLIVAWRVGRLRAVLPLLVADLLGRVDSDLMAIPAVEQLGDDELVVLLQRSRQELAAVHGHEVLAGMLEPEIQRPSLASLALAALAEGKRLGLSDGAITSRHPVVLALTAPRVGPPASLPEVPLGRASPYSTLGRLGDREALRVRARWIQEATALAASELGRRLADAGTIPRQDTVGELTLEELVRAVECGQAPTDTAGRSSVAPTPPLPAAFRLTASGLPVAVRRPGSAARAAGGGRGSGRVAAPGARPHPGEVLVVPTLDPQLAGDLAGLAGLVCETGSPLSHLAILAREMHVPTVVGVVDALRRFPAGSTVLVDGDSGDVTMAGEGEEVR